VAGSAEEIVRRAFEVISRSESADAVMAELDELMDPEIEWVNPEDAIEGGTRKGLAGMRTAFESFYEGAGGGATWELEEVQERGERVFVRARLHVKGASSGAEAVGPPGGVVFTIRDGRVIRMAWRVDPHEAFAEFAGGG
jgi:ketosteroid isomerase-like protein